MDETRDSLMTLEDISMSYGVIMIDTCVLIGDRNKNSPKKDKIKRRIKSADFIIKKLSSGIDISVTKMVLGEYQKGPYIDGLNEALMHDYSRKRQELISIIGRMGRVIELNDQESEIYQRKLLQNMPFISGKVDSPADIDFLISGLTFSSMGRNTALLTNDRGIYLAWKNIIGNVKSLNSENLGIFSRYGGEKFVLRYL